MIGPSYTLYTQVWASLLLASFVPQHVPSVAPSHPLLHSPLYHIPPPLKDVP